MGDSHVLADYLSSTPEVQTIRPVELGSSSSPISYGSFIIGQRRPLRMMINSNPALDKLQVIEKLIEPWAPHLVNLSVQLIPSMYAKSRRTKKSYFAKINPCLPLLDELTFREQYASSKHCIYPALLPCLYAHLLAFWRYGPILSQVRCPDSRFIRNVAKEAVYSELHLSPGKSTIIAILLNVGGRPTTSMTGNSMQLGSAVALCHSLGLNHNPLFWDIPQAEKHLRMKIWWSVLIHDRWFVLQNPIVYDAFSSLSLKHTMFL